MILVYDKRAGLVYKISVDLLCVGDIIEAIELILIRKEVLGGIVDDKQCAILGDLVYLGDLKSLDLQTSVDKQLCKISGGNAHLGGGILGIVVGFTVVGEEVYCGVVDSGERGKHAYHLIFTVVGEVILGPEAACVKHAVLGTVGDDHVGRLDGLSGRGLVHSDGVGVNAQVYRFNSDVVISVAERQSHKVCAAHILARGEVVGIGTEGELYLPFVSLFILCVQYSVAGADHLIAESVEALGSHIREDQSLSTHVGEKHIENEEKNYSSTGYGCENLCMGTFTLK